ncbi:MAG: hypothetical protein M3O15_02305 [Acidobacteriota bacterium]|nr:hypothetical protein [Acidobacteriota bacterium]
MSSSTTPARQVTFDSTPEIFATDTGGSFTYPLLAAGKSFLATGTYDEVRFVFSIWHPSGQRTIDLDRAYVELRASFDPDEEHWTKIAEIEPVVPPYAGGESFDGWIVLPILGTSTAFALVGSGFEPRARLQIRASAYFVA